MQTLEAVLAEHAFFRDLPHDDLQLIAGCGSNVRFPGGMPLFHEGDPADRFYLIRHGRVALEIASPERGRVVIQTLGEGDLLGWSWLVILGTAGTMLLSVLLRPTLDGRR